MFEPQWTKFQHRYPGGANILELAGNWTFGIVPSVMRYSMLIADSPATQVYIKTHLYCNSNGINNTSDVRNGIGEEDITLFMSYNNAKILYATSNP